MRVHNTNTKKIIWSRFPLDDGQAAVDGELAIPGVAGTGAPVKLEFREPGGATTGKLLPTGNVADTLDVPGLGKVARFDGRCGERLRFRPCSRPRHQGNGIARTTSMPIPSCSKKLEAIRVAASVAMGVMKTPEEAAKRKSVPFVGFVSGPQDAKTLTGEALGADSVRTLPAA